jgi:hypothetical protein
LIRSTNLGSPAADFNTGRRPGLDWHRGAYLKRYLVEFDFRCALGIEDAKRMARSVKGIVGKRLTYRASYIEAINFDAPCDLSKN